MNYEVTELRSGFEIRIPISDPSSKIWVDTQGNTLFVRQEVASFRKSRYQKGRIDGKVIASMQLPRNAREDRISYRRKGNELQIHVPKKAADLFFNLVEMRTGNHNSTSV